MATAHPASDQPTVRDSAPGFSANDLPRRFGRYTLLRRIAKGGMGEVLLGATMGLEGAERPIIIKMIRSEHRTDASFKARFLDEARVQAQLAHSGIAQVMEATTDDASGEPYVAVEYIDGRSLGDIRQRTLSLGEKLPWQDAVALATMVADALAHMHERKDSGGRPLGIVHRDLSPQNIMVSYQGELKVIDFGTARGLNRRCHTVAGVVFAKPGYVAPEVANGDTGDYRVDLYALGVILWELLKGTRFLQGDAADHMAQVGKGVRELPEIADESGAPMAIDSILQKLTCHDRDHRYTETRLAARDLAGLLASTAALPNGERGVRARTAALMDRLFPGDSMKSRREFGKLVAQARKTLAGQPTPHSQAPLALVKSTSDEEKGLLPGTRYRIVREIGQGESSVVHEAIHVDLGRRVALKIVRTEKTSSEQAMDRIRREARALSLVRSPGVVSLIDVGKALDDRAFSVMELCEGKTLDKELAAADGRIEVMTGLRILERTLAALETVHAAGVIHRDLKPENVFVTESGEVKILDFGIALIQGESAAGKATAPSKNGVEIFGTPEYMAPEQASQGRADERSDIYAIGSIMYEMLSGSLPFSAKSVVSLLEIKAQGSPEPVKRQGEKLPKDAEEICMRALSRHPSLRYPSAAEMRADILRVLAGPDHRRSKLRRFATIAAVSTAAVCALAVIASGARSPAELREAAMHWKDRVSGWVHPTEVTPATVDPATDEPDATVADNAAASKGESAAAPLPPIPATPPTDSQASTDSSPPPSASSDPAADESDDHGKGKKNKQHSHTAQKKKRHNAKTPVE